MNDERRLFVWKICLRNYSRVDGVEGLVLVPEDESDLVAVNGRGNVAGQLHGAALDGRDRRFDTCKKKKELCNLFQTRAKDRILGTTKKSQIADDQFAFSIKENWKDYLKSRLRRIRFFTMNHAKVIFCRVLFSRSLLHLWYLASGRSQTRETFFWWRNAKTDAFPIISSLSRTFSSSSTSPTTSSSSSSAASSPSPTNVTYFHSELPDGYWTIE